MNPEKNAARKFAEEARRRADKEYSGTSSARQQTRSAIGFGYRNSLMAICLSNSILWDTFYFEIFSTN